jgi:hypothetical protein
MIQDGKNCLLTSSTDILHSIWKKVCKTSVSSVSHLQRTINQPLKSEADKKQMKQMFCKLFQP